jgi:hypothetical protein
VVVDRLTSELVSTQATSPEAPASASPGDQAPTSAEAASIDAGELVLVNWSGVEIADESLGQQCQAAWNRQVVEVRHAGGRSSISADEDAIAELAESPASVGIVLVVKAWEPPVMELLDFIRDLRRAAGPRRLIVVTPTGIRASDQLAPPEPGDLAQWEKRLRGLQDPALSVRPWTEGAAR